MKKAFALAIALFSIWPAFAQVRAATPGVSSDSIIIGYTMPLSGSLGEMGRELALTTETVFGKYNAQGGVYGRKLILRRYDSEMDPDKALANYRRLILEDKVFAVLFGFGSFVRTCYPLFEENKVPWLFPWAPPEDMMFPARKYLFSLFPTTSSQMKVEAKWIIAQRKWKRLACIYGDSDSGRTGLDTLKAMLASSGVDLVAAEPIAVDGESAVVQVARISRAKPDIVLIIGMVHKPAALVIMEARKMGLKADLMLQMSLVGPSIPNLLPGLNLDGLYSAWWGSLQYPSSQQTETKHMKDMRLLLMASHPEIYNDANIGGNVEHGLSVELFVDALMKAGKDLTREGLIKALEGMRDYDAGKGNFVTFSPTRREGIAGGYMVQMKGGDWLPVSRWIDVDVGE